MFIGLDPTSCRIGAQYSQNHELVRSNFNIAILARFATVSSNSKIRPLNQPFSKQTTETNLPVLVVLGIHFITAHVLLSVALLQRNDRLHV